MVKRDEVGSATRMLYGSRTLEWTGAGVNVCRGTAVELTKTGRRPEQTEQLVGTVSATGTKTGQRSYRNLS